MLGKFSTTISSKIFSVPFFFSSFSGTPIAQILVCLILPQWCLRLSSIPFIPFPLFCSSAVISTILSSSSLIRSSASVILLLGPDRVLLEKAMASHSSVLAWRIPWIEEPDGLQSTGSLGVRYDWATSLSIFTFMHWRRKWQPTPVFLPGKSQGWGSLVGCRLWGCTESDTTDVT